MSRKGLPLRAKESLKGSQEDRRPQEMKSIHKLSRKGTLKATGINEESGSHTELSSAVIS